MIRLPWQATHTIPRVNKPRSNLSPSSATAPGTPAWTRQTLRDPHAIDDKPRRVKSMFGAIAHRYDLNNRLHSFGRDQAWRKVAVREANVTPDSHVLDVACGTGDLSEAMARAGAAHVTGLDFTPEMLDRARDRKSHLPESLKQKIDYIEGDAMDLPFDDASFDALSIAFGIRNVRDPKVAIAQFRRVLRPGARLVILEFDKPRSPIIRWGNDLYCNHIMPRTASLISGDRSGAYFYLPRSVETFLGRDALAELLTDAGFDELRQTPLTFGVCVCTSARRV